MLLSGQLHAPGVFTPVKNPGLHLNRSLGGLHSRSGRFREGKISHGPAGTRTPDRQVCSLLDNVVKGAHSEFSSLCALDKGS